MHGTIINTGYLQRLEIVHSTYRGRVSSEQRRYPNGTYVEAEVLSVGARSLDVKLLDETFDSFGELGGETAAVSQ
ncbi:hypothetical protein PLANPX_6075 [Lacipirellula parvula]|uniref:Uncharacterized protein n=1 Tax=Lacipirellula parvula TaxID=2650471 RepID=A0A5K7XNL8_9BACT|nr:hypothetical protein PLANPX_6075 [Lacipirellula parvula]